MYVCIYVCMYVCIYTHIHTQGIWTCIAPRFPPTAFCALGHVVVTTCHGQTFLPWLDMNKPGPLLCYRIPLLVALIELPLPSQSMTGIVH